MNAAEKFLKGKTAKVPNWAWVMGLSGAILLGLYLRNKSSNETTSEGSEEYVEPAGEDSLASYNGTESAGGLAAAGVIGPAGSSLVPVQTPLLPEGFTDVVETLGNTVAELGSTIAQRDETSAEVKADNGEPLIASGPPTEGGNHETPKKCKKEITRLEGEVHSLQTQIANLTSQIKGEKGKKKPDKSRIQNLEQSRNQAQGSVGAKQARLQAERAVCR